MIDRRRTYIQGWTLSETLVMMIVAGVIFLAVMDGVTLFMRFSQTKSREIGENSRFYEGYYRLVHLTAWADSAHAEAGRVVLLRESVPIGELSTNDSLLVNRVGHFTDTLMAGVGNLVLAAMPGNAVCDSLLLTITNPDGWQLPLSFPIKRPVHTHTTGSLSEAEKPYRYEEK